MIKFSKMIVKMRVPILVIALLLIFPSVLGMLNTRVNYDMLTYLPDNIDTIKGQNILHDDFGKGAFSLIIVEGMDDKDVSALEDKIKQVDHVESVIWYSDIADISIPKEVIPEKYYDKFNNGDATMMAVFFDTTVSADETMQAIRDIRALSTEKCFITGMSAMVTDLAALCEKEEPIYVGIAVVLALVAMMIFLDSWLIPFIFLASIGIAIIWNLGSNIMFGEVSYITKALSAVLQLAVTMDYSIFLWHSYNEQKVRFNNDKKRAMAHAISNTITSVIGSSVTTIAGFLALCFMSFTLGKDLGLVMAKGVLLGVISAVTTLPALILIFDRPLEKSRHKSLIPDMKKVSTFIVKRSWIFLVLFVIILAPAIYGYRNTQVYYDMSSSLPKDMEFVIANTELKDKFNMSTTHMILCNADMEPVKCEEMMSQVENVDGVTDVVGYNSLVGTEIPEEVIPSSLTNTLKNGGYQLILVNSEYHVASDEVNSQIDQINNIIKKYDTNGMLIGEAACTKDMIRITNHDFDVVDTISIAAIFVIILLVLKSLSLPFILVMVIEFAIFINLGLPFYTNTTLPFIAPICISTIQLGATVDYAILMTTRYKKERSLGNGKNESIITALSASMPSIIVSALGFFAATIGVSIYSNIDIIKSMCGLMGRGALISMFAVCLVLPGLLRLFDAPIRHTTLGMKPKKKAVLQTAGAPAEAVNTENNDPQQSTISSADINDTNNTEVKNDETNK